MAYENIQYDVRDQIATITLNRPHALNTFNWDMFKELHAALDTIERDDAVRVLIITGAPRPDGRPLFRRVSMLRPGPKAKAHRPSTAAPG